MFHKKIFMLNIFGIYFYFVTYNLLIFNFIILLGVVPSKIIYLNQFSEITIIVKGNGTKNIFSNTKRCGEVKQISFNQFPDRIILNNETKNFTNNTIDLINSINIISLQWDNPVTDCTLMFDRVFHIISFDFSKFDTSKVTDMRCMFCNSQISSLDITNFNTSLVVNMRSMFNKCINLKSLDLNNFDTSKVTDLFHLFYICSALTSLNMSNFEINSTANIQNMFQECTSLVSLDLSSFDTQKLINEATNIFLNASDYLILSIKYQDMVININSSCFKKGYKNKEETSDFIYNCMLNVLYNSGYIIITDII